MIAYRSADLVREANYATAPVTRYTWHVEERYTDEHGRTALIDSSTHLTRDEALAVHERLVRIQPGVYGGDSQYRLVVVGPDRVAPSMQVGSAPRRLLPKRWTR